MITVSLTILLREPAIGWNYMVSYIRFAELVLNGENNFNGQEQWRTMLNKLTQRHIFTRGERRRFMKATRTWEELIFVRLGFMAGLRISECAKLQVKDVLVEEEVLHIRKSKRNKSRYANVDLSTILLLNGYAKEKGLTEEDYFFPSYKEEGGHVHTRTLARYFGNILKRSGIKAESVRFQTTSESYTSIKVNLILRWNTTNDTFRLLKKLEINGEKDLLPETYPLSTMKKENLTRQLNSGIKASTYLKRLGIRVGSVLQPKSLVIYTMKKERETKHWSPIKDISQFMKRWE